MKQVILGRALIGPRHSPRMTSRIEPLNIYRAVPNRFSYFLFSTSKKNRWISFRQQQRTKKNMVERFSSWLSIVEECSCHPGMADAIVCWQLTNCAIIRWSNSGPLYLLLSKMQALIIHVFFSTKAGNAWLCSLELPIFNVNWNE